MNSHEPQDGSRIELFTLIYGLINCIIDLTMLLGVKNIPCFFLSFFSNILVRFKDISL